MKNTRNKYHHQVRRCQRAEAFLRNQKLAENCIKNNNDLFDELKNKRKVKSKDDLVIDTKSGKEIPEHFADIYSKLFNKHVGSQDMTNSIYDHIDSLITDDNNDVLERVNSGAIREAIGKLKPGKSDPILDFGTDFLINGGDALHDHLAQLIKSFLIHGYVPLKILEFIMVPVVKDKNGDLCDSSNYRSISISSVILKLIDWVIILLYGDRLESDEFQFGFQKGSNPLVCSWLLNEVLDCYLRKKSDVHVVLMDCSKAFDTVSHKLLFEKLLARKMPPIILRLMLFCYIHQTARVRWEGCLSRVFGITNGVRQGAVISPILFSVYSDKLFLLMKRAGAGCWLGSSYAGLLGYADDLLIMSPSRSGTQKLLKLAETYAQQHLVSFSTNVIPSKSKTKAIFFASGSRSALPVNLKLNGNNLPWVSSAKYLGCTITDKVDGMLKDVEIKRAIYLGKCAEIRQEFYAAHPAVLCNLNSIYNSAFYGSVLYDFNSSWFLKLLNSWSTAVRSFWNLPPNTHRKFIEPLGGIHAKGIIYSNYIGFIQFLSRSPKLSVLYLLNRCLSDQQTLTGKNCKTVYAVCDSSTSPSRGLLGKISNVDKKQFKRDFKFIDDDEGDILWKTEMIIEMTNIKRNILKLGLTEDHEDDDDNYDDQAEFNNDDHDMIIKWLCTE